MEFFLLNPGAFAGMNGVEQLGLELGNVGFDFGFGFQVDRWR